MRIGADRENKARREAQRLVETYGDLALRLAYTYLGSRQDAEDVSQDVLCKLITHRKPFNGPEHQKAWVIRCTINACKDLLRSAAHTRNVSLGEATNLPLVALTLDAQNIPGQVTRAVMDLPPLYREVIYLHYYEDMSIKEIAAALNAGPSAVAKRLSRAREKLRERLEEHDDGPNDAHDSADVSRRNGNDQAFRREAPADDGCHRLSGAVAESY